MNELSDIALAFCMECMDWADAQIPRKASTAGREIHCYAGRNVIRRLDFHDLNAVIAAAARWCDAQTRNLVITWENKNDSTATAAVWADSRIILEVVYNNFETMEYYACVWSRATQVLARSYKNCTPTKAIMTACVEAALKLKEPSCT